MMDRFWRALLGRSATQRENTPAAPGMEAPDHPVGGIARLTSADRADCCGKPSRVAVLLNFDVDSKMLQSGVIEPPADPKLSRLDFCAEHYPKNQAALAPFVDAVRDERSPHERVAPRALGAVP